MATTYAIPDGRMAMAATLYTGNGSTQAISNAVNGVGFQPGLVWTKPRVAAVGHSLYDSNRGIYNALSSNGTDQEYNYSPYGVTAFSSSGFSVNDVSNGGYRVNGASGGTYSGTPPYYVAWQWKAGGTAVSNTAGSITSSVSANTTAGFSVVTYTGTGSTGTIGHGLGVAPSMVIFKNRSSAQSWRTYHASVGVNAYLLLDSTAASTGDSGWTATSSTTFSVGGSGAQYNASTNTYVAYCFAPVAGYSAFGSAVGNGSADGVFVYTGFLPRFILWKKSSSTGDWRMWDSSRSPFDAAQKILYPNGADAEYDPNNGTTNIDFLSNGFKFRSANLNESGATYIYACFAENPFKYANAR